MPRGRGWRPNQAPRKRGGRRKHPSTDNATTFPRLGLTEDRQSYPQAFAQSTPFSESIFQFNNNGQASYLKEQPCMSAPTLGQSISPPILISQPMPTKQRMPISQPMPINQPTAQQLSNPAGSFPHQCLSTVPRPNNRPILLVHFHTNQCQSTNPQSNNRPFLLVRFTR